MSGIGWLSGLLRTSGDGAVGVGAGVGGAKVIGVAVGSAEGLFSTEPPTSGGSELGNCAPAVGVPGSVCWTGVASGVAVVAGVAESVGTGVSFWLAEDVALGRLRPEGDFGVVAGEGAVAGVGVALGFFLNSRCKRPGAFSFSTGKARGTTGVGEDCALNIPVVKLPKRTSRRHFLRFAEAEVNTGKW